ncbi:MAG: ATP-binding protein [Atopobiaceae bacterium]|nr:ATP-binding protein [Atopobiaceae bacterium]
MTETFYPFVENGESTDSTPETALVVRHSARIAVFDDRGAAPRVVIIDPSDIRSYLEEITATVTKLAQEQGGRIPFTVIREVVENLIHAYFIEPTVSILDGGNTIRFSDQGPGIHDKQRALEYGTTSATTEMKRYIRGVGSGLPYAQQWLEEKGGSLSVEDNMHRGTVVTISLVQDGESHEEPYSLYQQPSNIAAQQGTYDPRMQQFPAQGYQGATTYQQPMWPGQPAGYGYPQQMPQGYGQPWPQQGYAPQPYQQQPYQQTYQQGYGQMSASQPWPQTAQQGYPQGMSGQAPMAAAVPTLSDREQLVLEYLRTHETVGPRDLNAWQPLSESTWSRVLAKLENMGLLSKQGGQKRRLTDSGRQLLGI